MNQVKQSKYLGLPMVTSNLERQVFNYIKEKVSNKLRGWKKKFLINARKEVLLKSVVLAMPTYAMACCKLPKALCRRMANFWWGRSEENRRIHWLGWMKLSEIKGKCGLGFRDLLDFNTTTLANHIG